MAKPFYEAFQEWVKDDSYEIGKDCGDEYFDCKEASPTLADSSLTTDHGRTNPT